MALDWLVPALAGAVSAVFAARVWGQYATRRRPHQLAWGLGLTAYALASFVEAYVATRPWSVPLYHAYFPLAGATVGLLGLGTMLLARVNLWTALFAAFTGLAVVVALVGPFALHLTDETPVEVDGQSVPLKDGGTNLGAAPVPFSNPGRVAFALLNAVGGLALIGGALWSWARTKRAGVLLIGLGAILPFLGGTLKDLTGTNVRVLLQFVGICVMFAGFLQGREVPSRAAAPSAEA